MRIIILFLLFSNVVYAGPLTPPREPKENSFYVCYERCRVKYSIYAPLSTFKKYQYVGCSIHTQPCDVICNPKIKHNANCHLKLFDWFNNYPQTLNAFYRCAYS